MTMRHFTRCAAGVLLLATLALPALPATLAAQAAPPTGDRVTTLPVIDNTTGPHVESVVTDKHLGYTAVLKQFKRPLLPPAVQRKLPANDTVLEFDIRWRHGERRLSGLLHAFRHGTQLHLAVHQKVYLDHGTTAATTARPQMVHLDLEGTVYDVRTDAKGFLIGKRVRLDFNAALPGELFGARIIMAGPLSIRRIGV
jgi:hypothetical protein